mgnify:CR=1 FL=1
MMSTARNYFREGWWHITFPGVALTLTVFAFNILGDGLQRAAFVELRAAGTGAWRPAAPPKAEWVSPPCFCSASVCTACSNTRSGSATF